MTAGRCKFCPLLDTNNSSGGEVTHHFIVEAIMQIAVTLSAKYDAGKFHNDISLIEQILLIMIIR